MDDPKVAFHIYEKAMELGVNLIAVHKGVPRGPQPVEGTQLYDVDQAKFVWVFTMARFAPVMGSPHNQIDYWITDRRHPPSTSLLRLEEVPKLCQLFRSLGEIPFANGDIGGFCRRRFSCLLKYQ